MPYKVSWYKFTEYPKSDTAWSLSVGPDGRIYTAACAELEPGETVKLVRYNEATDSLDYLFDLDKMVDDPRDSGRATQCKIHYSFAPSLADGILYMATHLSGPPIDQPIYSPWRSWNDPERCFRGAALLAFDTKTDQVLWWDTLIPKEGCRCLVHDDQNRRLYAISYPRDHLIMYDLDKKQPRDLGRIGSINSQTLFLDRTKRVWTTNDYGHLVRYDPQTDRMETCPDVLPHHQQTQTGWHSVFYDIAPSPQGDCVYASTWNGSPRLMRIWPNETPWPRVEDLGPATQQWDNTLPSSMEVDHCGGLTFAGDGMLYYVASRWQGKMTSKVWENDQKLKGIVYRLDPSTLEREEVATLHQPDAPSHYVPRGAVDHNGDLFFSSISPEAPPTGMFKVHMPAERKKENAHLPIRMWG